MNTTVYQVFNIPIILGLPSANTCPGIMGGQITFGIGLSSLWEDLSSNAFTRSIARGKILKLTFEAEFGHVAPHAAHAHVNEILIHDELIDWRLLERSVRGEAVL